MFSFLNPLFLLAGAAAIIPLVLHMMQRRRIVRIPFSTIRFLKLAEKRSSRRMKLENFLLWLLRTLLMLLLAIAFAMPMLRTSVFGRFLSRAERDIAIVLDGSYSMGYNTGKDTVWDKAVQSATAVVNGLADGDEVCIFVANDDMTPVVEQLTADKEFAVAQLKALEAGTTRSELCPAMIAAYDSLKQAGRRREREIHIITDGQALPWTGFRDQKSEVRGKREEKTEENIERRSKSKQQTTDKRSSLDLWDPAKIDKRTAFFVTLTGVSAPENVTPLDIELQPQLIMSGMSSQVKVKLGYSGPAQDSTVSVYVDDKEITSRSAILGSESAECVTFTLPPLTPGAHGARVETPSDNLPVDNSFHFLIRVEEKLPSLCVGTEDDAFYLMKALNTSVTSTSAMAVKRVGADELANEELSTYSCIFVCNALPLPGQAIVKVEQYVRTGGLLVIFPGNRGIVGDYETWTCLPGLPSSFKDITISARKRMLLWEKPQHPLLRELKLGPGGAPVVTIRRELRWEKLHEASEALILAGAENPFLLSRGCGNGQVLFFSVSADRSWSSFPLSPFFLPITHQAVQYGAGIAGISPYLWTTRSLSLAEQLPAATKESALLDPNKDSVPIRSSIVDNRTLLRAEDLLLPGVYLLSRRDSTKKEPALAINVDRAESDLTPIKQKDIPDIIGTKNVSVAVGKEELLRLVREYRVGRTLGELVLWLAFMLALAEVFYANQKTKSALPLSQTLEIEASGKVNIKGAGSGKR